MDMNIRKAENGWIVTLYGNSPELSGTTHIFTSVTAAAAWVEDRLHSEVSKSPGAERAEELNQSASDAFDEMAAEQIASPALAVHTWTPASPQPAEVFEGDDPNPQEEPQ